VRTEAIADAMLAAGSIRGGINSSKEKKAAAQQALANHSSSVDPAISPSDEPNTADGQSTEQRQPATVN
jgi:hypothetical protein